MPKLECFNEEMRSLVTYSKRCLYLEDLAGLPVGHLPMGPSYAFRQLLEQGCMIFAQPTREPISSFSPWPDVKEKGGGVVIPSNFIVRCKSEKVVEVLKILSDSINKMNEIV